MQHPFTLPEALCAFIRSLPTPPTITLPTHSDTWPNPDHPGDTTVAPPVYPPPTAWLAARDAYIGHVMTCPLCVTHGPKVPRLCPEGVILRLRYDSTPYDDSAPLAR